MASRHVFTRSELETIVRTDPNVLIDMFLALQDQVVRLEERVRQLEARLDQDSHNSHQPPSSEGYAKPAPKSLREKSDRPSGGQLRRKRSSYFKAMLEELGMDTQPEAYLPLVPWEVLAGINLSFRLSERKRFYLRYIGGLLYFETAVPAAFRPYQAAAERLGLSAAAGGYWALHIREDERHGRWMIDDVALPLADLYPHDAWEMIWGFDQQRLISERAGEAVARACRHADQTIITPKPV
jgi:hypothetical protein